MRCDMGLRNRLNLISELGYETKFQVLEYESLGGVNDIESTLAIKHMEESGKRLKQIRIVLDDTSVKIQDDSLSYMKGYINRNDKVTEYKGIKKVLLDMSNKEYLLKTTFNGSGEILLEPSFDDYVLIELIDEEIVINDSIFSACDNEIDIIKVTDDEIKLKGSGIVALKLPVAENEIIRCKLFNDILIVNGDFVILKSEKIKVYDEKYEKITGEDFIEEVNTVYEGVGEVWLLPTKSIYEKYKSL